MSNPNAFGHHGSVFGGNCGGSFGRGACGGFGGSGGAMDG
jgi:hypothetical protein